MTISFSNVNISHKWDKNHFYGQMEIKTYLELDLRENEKRVCSYWAQYHNVKREKGVVPDGD